MRRAALGRVSRRLARAEGVSMSFGSAVLAAALTLVPSTTHAEPAPAPTPSSTASAPEGAPTEVAAVPEVPPAPPASPETPPPPAPAGTASSPGEKPAERTAPRLEIEGPAPAPADSGRESLPRTRRPSLPFTHDGFFFRFAAGPGLFRAASGTSPDNRHFSGGTVHLEAAIGLTPAKGFVVGLAYLRSMVFSLTSRDDVIDGDEPTLEDVAFTVSTGGVFVDIYPDPKSGLHVGGFLGVGSLLTGREGIDVPSGATLSAMGGYEWFVADQWSLGVIARATVGFYDVSETSSFVSTSNRTDVSFFVPALLMGATYN